MIVSFDPEAGTAYFECPVHGKLARLDLGSMLLGIVKLGIMQQIGKPYNYEPIELGGACLLCEPEKPTLSLSDRNGQNVG